MMAMIMNFYRYLRFAIQGDKPRNHARVNGRQNVSQLSGYSLEVLEENLAIFVVDMCLA